jgi:hypothetical protein
MVNASLVFGYISCLLRYPGESNEDALARIGDYYDEDIASFSNSQLLAVINQWYNKDIALTPESLADITGTKVVEQGPVEQVSVYINAIRNSIREHRMREAGRKLAAGQMDIADAISAAEVTSMDCLSITEQLEIGSAMYHDLADNFDSPRIRFPWWGVNRMIPYVHNDDLIIFSGLTGAGKSSAALQMAIHNARYFPVIYFHNEDDEMNVALRIISQLQIVEDPNCTGSGLDYYKLLDSPRAHLSSVDHWRSIIPELVPGLNLVYCPGKTPEQIISTWRRLRKRLGIKLVIIDYLNKLEVSHLIKSRGSVAYGYEYAIELIKRECGHTGNMMPCVLVQQESEDRKTRDTRSGVIKGQVAISFERDTDQDGMKLTGSIVVRKANKGRTGATPARFVPQYMLWK